jgi:acetyl-CoA synthetase
MRLIDKYLEQTDFASYEEFTQKFRIKVPKRFNFAYDVVDEWAKEHLISSRSFIRTITV